MSALQVHTTELRWGLVTGKDGPVFGHGVGTWPELAKTLTTHTVAPNKDGAGWLPADIAPGPRSGDRAGPWCVLALDIEAPTVNTPEGKALTGTTFPPPLRDIAERMRLFGMAGALATSHSHEAPIRGDTLGPRYRVTLPVSRPIAVHEIKPLAFSVAELLALREWLDTNCLDAARLFYLPRVPEERKYFADSKIIDGEPLDVDRFLSSQALPHASVQRVSGPDSSLSAVRAAITDLELSDLRDATMFLAGVGYGSAYGEWQSIGAALRSEARGGQAPKLLALWIDYSRICGGYKNDADVLEKWEEVGGQRSSKGAVFSKATELGWINPAIGRKDTTPIVPNPARYKLLGSKEIREMPPTEWRVRHVFPARGVAALYGPSGSGKSFLALHMAAAIAEGKMWFGHRVKPAQVIYVALEGDAGFKQRFEALELHWGHPLPDGLRLVLRQPMRLTTQQDVEDLAAVVPPGAVVFVDTLNRAAPDSDENSSKDMGVIVEGAKRLQSVTDGLVVLIHHTGKDGERGMRGHSSLFAAMDAVLEVKRDKDQRRWGVAKSKDGEDGKAHGFKLVTLPLGNDAEGEAVSSCVVEPTAGFTESARPSKSEQMVWDALLTTGGHGATRDQLREMVYAGRDGTPDAKRKAFNRAVGALTRTGMVLESGQGLLSASTLFNAA